MTEPDPSSSSQTEQISESVDSHDIQIAAALVQDAVASRSMHFKTDAKSLRLYKVYNHLAFKVTLYCCTWALLFLAVFEKPAHHTVALPYWGSMIIEAAIILFFIFRFIHNWSFTESSHFWKDPKNIAVSVTIVLTVLDMVCYSMWVSLAPPWLADRAVRWSRPLRPLFLINFPEGRQLRKAFRNIRRTLPDVAHILVLFIASIAIFALLALKLLQNRKFTYPDGREYFNNYFESLWDLYILVTTANNPDVMMPAYDNNNWFALFFFVYVVVNIFIFMNILFASIYNNYKRHLKNEVKGTIRGKQRHLLKAFDLLKEFQDGAYAITPTRWSCLMYTVAPSCGSVKQDLLFRVLDDSGSNSLDKRDFIKLADLLNVELTEMRMKPTTLETFFPKIYLSRPSQLLRMTVNHRYFHHTFEFLILLNAFVIAFNLESAEWAFLAAFTLEIILRLYTVGPRCYFTAFWDIFDFLVVAPAVIGTIVEVSLGNYDDRVKLIDFLMVIRVLKLLRLIASIKRFEIVLTTIANIGPSIATYGVVILVFFYVYAIVGMELFGGLVRYYGYERHNETALFCGNAPRLTGSEFVAKRYCSNNFNTVGHAFVLLTELMLVNQWHVISRGFVLVTSKAARLYFLSFHMTCVILLLNILTAFIVEVFMLEYNVSQSTLQTTIEARIKDLGLGFQRASSAPSRRVDKQVLVDNADQIEISMSAPAAAAQPVNKMAASTSTLADDCGLRFRLKKNSRKKVETLLENMFKGELMATEGDGVTTYDDVVFTDACTAR